MIQAIIFDFDGVIFDSEPFHYRAWYDVLKPYGIELDYKSYLQKYVGLTEEEAFSLLAQEFNHSFSETQSQNLIAQKIDQYKKTLLHAKNVCSINGFQDFLQRTQTWIKHYAICTNSKGNELEFVLDKLDDGFIKRFFKFITTVDQLQKGKPSPEGYLKTAKDLGVPPNQCVVIEDTCHGIKAAKAAQMKVIGLATTHDSAVLKDADYVAKNYVEVEIWLSERLTS